MFSRLGSAAGGSSGSVFSRLSGIGGERRGSSWHKVTVSVWNCRGDGDGVTGGNMRQHSPDRTAYTFQAHCLENVHVLTAFYA